MSSRKVVYASEFFHFFKMSFNCSYLRFLYTKPSGEAEWLYASIYACLKDILSDRGLYAAEGTAVYTRSFPLTGDEMAEEIEDLNLWLTDTGIRIVRIYAEGHPGCLQEECANESCDGRNITWVEFEEFDDLYRPEKGDQVVKSRSTPLWVVVKRKQNRRLCRLQVMSFETFRSAFDAVYFSSCKPNIATCDPALSDPNLQAHAVHLVKEAGMNNNVNRWRLRRRRFYEESSTTLQHQFADIAYQSTIDRCLLYGKEYIEPRLCISAGDDRISTLAYQICEVLCSFSIKDVAELITSYVVYLHGRPSERCRGFSKQRTRCPFSRHRCIRHVKYKKKYSSR